MDLGALPELAMHGGITPLHIAVVAHNGRVSSLPGHTIIRAHSRHALLQNLDEDERCFESFRFGCLFNCWHAAGVVTPAVACQVYVAIPAGPWCVPLITRWGHT